MSIFFVSKWRFVGVVLVGVTACVVDVHTQKITTNNSTNPLKSRNDNKTNPTSVSEPSLVVRSKITNNNSSDPMKTKRPEVESMQIRRRLDTAENVSFNGKQYATLDSWDPIDTVTQGCQSDYLPVPPGWGIAQNSPDSISVTAQYAWGTDLLVLSDGSQYYTNNPRYAGQAGEAREWYCCSDGLTALGSNVQGGMGVYKVNSCSRRILIVFPDPCQADGATGSPCMLSFLFILLHVPLPPRTLALNTE